jgi:hypothetical protein
MVLLLSCSTIPLVRPPDLLAPGWGGMAERPGFEPGVEFPPHTLSRRAPSTTRTPLRGGRETVARLSRPSGARRALGRSSVAERVGFEPTWELPPNPLSRRARYDHFGTSPCRATSSSPSPRRGRSDTPGARRAACRGTWRIATPDRSLSSAPIRRSGPPGSSARFRPT